MELYQAQNIVKMVSRNTNNQSSEIEDFPSKVSAVHPLNLIPWEWVISIKEKDWDIMEKLIQPKMEEMFTNKLMETISSTSFNLNK